jgi:epoxyqueuosine reductase
MTSDISENSKHIKRVAYELGADIVGFADTSKLRGIFTHPVDLLDRFPYAISIGVHLDRWSDYNAATEDRFAIPLLERIAREVKRTVESRGYAAKVVLPDKKVSHNSPLYWNGEISHKAVAKAAGLGWIGKSTLLVSPNLGPRLFLVTVLTDMPLSAGRPMRNQCRSCKLCILACPRGALKEARFADHPERINLSIDVKACGALVNRTWRDGSMCYECMLVCPKGRSKGKRKKSKE